MRNGYEYITDDLGRLSEARAATLRLAEDTPRHPYSADVGNLGGAEYQGGHPIARLFGGASEGVTLFPQLASVNNGAFGSLEAGWRRAIDPALGGREGAITNVRVQLVYDPGNTTIVPDRYIVTWDENGVPRSTPPFEN